MGRYYSRAALVPARAHHTKKQDDTMATKASTKTASQPAVKTTARAKPQTAAPKPKAAPALAPAQAAAKTKATAKAVSKPVAKPVAKTAAKTVVTALAKKALSAKPVTAPKVAGKPVAKRVAARPTAKQASAKPSRAAPGKVAKPPKEISPHGLVKGKHIVCFWKQNDLGLFGRRPDRWIALWEQDPKVEKVLVFETPLSHVALEEWLKRAITLDATSGSEYRLLLDQAVAKLQGHCDTAKTTYKTYLTPADKPADNQDYLRWVLQQVKDQGISAPTVVLWPACYANAALVKAMKPQQIITDLVDDQRLFPANAQLVPTITAQYQMWLGLSDLVLSNSLGLIEAFSKEFAHGGIAYLPNTALAAAPAKTKAVTPRAGKAGKAAKKRLVVGFVGNMRERMDSEALLKAMAENPDKDFWFVGQTHGSAFYAKARNQPNCKFWGTLRQDEAEAVVAQFDVAIVPFLDTPLVARMSPMKRETYAKGKVPVVALGGLKGL
jgi:glycosyltransferase involved in cell wall biosynthesis